MNRSGRPHSARPSRKARSRPVLRGEQLENRSLLDGAGGANVLLNYLSSSGQSVYHNPSMPSDVDANAQVSLADLVHLSNDLRANGQRALNPAGSALGGAAGESGSQHFFVDVNGDNQANLADMDALARTLGGANAQPDQVAITLTVTDTSNNPLPVDGGGIPQINIGDHYLLHMQVDDLRTSAAITRPGVDLAYADITYDSALTTPISGTVTTPVWYNQENTYTDISVAGQIGNFGAKATAGLPYSNGLETLVPGTIPSIPIEMISMELVGTFAGLVTFTSNNPWFFEGAPNGFDIAVQQDPAFINSVPFDEVIFGSVQVNIAVVGVVAQDDFASTTEDTPVSIPIGSGLTDNDLAEAGGSVVFVGVGASGAATAPTSQGGTVTVSGGNVLYTPPTPDFFGVDTFDYKIRNGSNAAQTDVGTVSVTVTEINDAPHAVADTVNTGLNTMKVIPFSDVLSNDWAGNIGDTYEQTAQTLTVTSVTTPTLHGGSAVINGTNIEYTPPLGYVGPDSFSYSIVDNGTTNGAPDPLSATGTINVNVGINAVNDTFTVQQASAGNMLDVLANDAPITATVTAVGSTSNGGSASVGPGGLSVTYTAPPVAGLNSIIDTFSYTITDPGGNMATATVTVTVNAPPDAVDDVPATNPTLIIVQNSSNNVLNVLANDLVGAGESKILSGIPTPPSHGSAFINGSNQLVYSPAPGYFGPDMLMYRLSDGNGGFDTATVTINVIVPPSILRGIVYFDVNNDGIRNAPTSAPAGSSDPAKYIALNTESAMAGVTIQLYAGSSAVGVPIATTTTAADGTYSFGIAANIQPGTYTLKQVQPAATIDGVETYTPVGGQPSQVVGVSTPADSTQDTITFTLTGSIDAGGFNFGERGLKPAFINAQGGYLNSTPQDSLTAAYDLATGQLWYSFRVSNAAATNWTHYIAARIHLVPQPGTGLDPLHVSQVQLEVDDIASATFHTTFGTADPQYQNFKILGQEGNLVVVRFNGPASNFSPFLPGAGPEADEHNLIDSFFSGGEL